MNLNCAWVAGWVGDGKRQAPRSSAGLSLSGWESDCLTMTSCKPFPHGWPTFPNHLAMGAEAKFEINYSMTQTVNLCFDNPHQVTGTLAYILDENIIMYAEGFLIHPFPQENASRV